MLTTPARRLVVRLARVAAGAVALLAGLNPGAGLAEVVALFVDEISAGISIEQPEPKGKSSRSRNSPLRTATSFTVSRKNSF
jgi:hypothetical protein